MLCVERTQLGQFDEADLASLVRADGWQSILPHALRDEQLLCIADQLRALLSGKGWDTPEESGSAALAMTLLLLSKGRAKHSQGNGLEDVEMATLHEVMTLLSVTVDREIVNRVLHYREEPTGPGLLQGIKELIQYRAIPASSPCLA
ncbi:MAG: hypothetical protein QM740_00625 [Acidovorax sp.]